MNKFRDNISYVFYIKNETGLYLREIIMDIPVFVDTRKDAIEFENEASAVATKREIFEKKGIKVFIEKYVIDLDRITCLDDIEGND